MNKPLTIIEKIRCRIAYEDKYGLTDYMGADKFEAGWNAALSVIEPTLRQVRYALIKIQFCEVRVQTGQQLIGGVNMEPLFSTVYNPAHAFARDAIITLNELLGEEKKICENKENKRD